LLAPEYTPLVANWSGVAIVVGFPTTSPVQFSKLEYLVEITPAEAEQLNTAPEVGLQVSSD
jgi:hypothetical protein